MAKQGKKNPKQEKKPAKKGKRVEKALLDINWMGKSPKWSFSNYDRMTPNNEWCVRSALQNSDVISALIDFEGMTWTDIEKATHGTKGKSKNHFIHLSAMNDEARSRCEKLEHEGLYSLRISNLERIFGFRVDDIFHVVWYDPNHKVSKVSK